MMELGMDAEYWIFPASYWNRTYEQFREQLDTMPAVQNKRVFDYQGSGEDAWFEQRYAQYYEVLQDYCHVIGTSTSALVRGDHWFRNVFTEAVGDPGTCDENATPSLPYVFEGCNDTLGGGGDGGGATSAASPFQTGTTTLMALRATSISVLALLLAAVNCQ
jgi:hypothetical protein